MQIIVRKSYNDKKWRYHFGDMQDWSKPFDTFEEAVKASGDDGYNWFYEE